MISKETISLISSLQSPILKALGDLKTEVKYFLDNGLSDYVDSIKKKFENTKTFLYRNENIPFYEVFFPVSVGFNATIRRITDEKELFDNTNCACIIGNAGCGKTMLIKHFFLNCIKSGYKIPIFIELRNLNGCELTFIEYIYQVIFDNKISPNQKILERILDTGQFIFLLDGYDEIFSSKKDTVTTDLDRFIDKYSRNNFVITSRPGSGIESFPRFNNFFVQPLKESEIFSFIDLALKTNADIKLASKIKEVIKRKENYDYKNFLNSPLLLSMFILTFNTYPELPRKKSKFYWNVFDTLATKHDSFTKKGGYQHERKTGLQNDEFELILEWFSYISLFEGKYNFDAQYLTSKLDQIKKALKLSYNTQELIEDLTLAIAIIIVDGIEYRFPHKSLQEYFCAQLIQGLGEQEKKRIYNTKLKNQMLYSAGGFENFWNLCYELDYNSFAKNFLIYNLEKFIGYMKDLESSEILKLFYQKTNFAQSSDYNTTSNNYLLTGGFMYQTDFGNYFKITKYLNLMDVEILSLAGSKNIKKINSYINDHRLNLVHESDGNYNAYYINFWNEEFEGLLLESGKFDIIKKFKNSIISKISEIHDQINNNYLVNESLLMI